MILSIKDINNIHDFGFQVDLSLSLVDLTLDHQVPTPSQLVDQQSK